MSTMQNRQLVERELRSGERLLWTGCPEPTGHLFPDGKTVAQFVVSLIIAGIFGTVSFIVMTEKGIEAAAIPLIITIVCGKGLVSPVLRYFAAKSQTYALTSDRALVIKEGSSRSVKSWETLDSVDVLEKDDGSANILFETPSYSKKDRRPTVTCGFVAVPDYRKMKPHLDRLIQAENDKGVNVS